VRIEFDSEPLRGYFVGEAFSDKFEVILDVSLGGLIVSKDISYMQNYVFINELLILKVISVVRKIKNYF